jgi:hypothetical protein
MRHQENITITLQNGIQEETKSGTRRPVPASQTFNLTKFNIWTNLKEIIPLEKPHLL